MSMKKEYDLLVYLEWILVLVTIVAGAVVVAVVPATDVLEISNIRFAAATFTGLLVLIIFSATLYMGTGNDKGKLIFERIISSITPIIGAVIGYIFAIAT